MPPRLKKVPLTIFQRFFRTETLGGLVLLGFGLAALAIANSPLSAAYNHLFEIPLTLGIVPHELSLSLHDWINDGLMAVFFLLVGLEIKRELLAAECLRASRRHGGGAGYLTVLLAGDRLECAGRRCGGAARVDWIQSNRYSSSVAVPAGRSRPMVFRSCLRCARHNCRGCPCLHD